MKKLLLVILCVLSLTACTSNYKTVSTVFHSSKSRFTVVIDAGHGGKDAGTIGVDSTPEKVINLSEALILYDYLMVCGIDAQLIRKGDYEYYPDNNHSRSDLYNRLDFVNSVSNSMLISIHQNHFDNENEWGCQVWYSPNDKKSKIIADNILQSVKQNLQPNNKRENKASDSSYYILYNAKVPSIMIECGFMSNPKENELLKNKEYQKDFAFSILTGICGEV